jgi:hypothetical protein
MPLRVWRHHGTTFDCLRGLHPNKKDNAKRQKMNGESIGVKLPGHRGISWCDNLQVNNGNLVSKSGHSASKI